MAETTPLAEMIAAAGLVGMGPKIGPLIDAFTDGLRAGLYEQFGIDQRGSDDASSASEPSRDVPANDVAVVPTSIEIPPGATVVRVTFIAPDLDEAPTQPTAQTMEQQIAALRPVHGATYFYVDGGVYQQPDLRRRINDMHWGTGNYFDTKEQAEEYQRRLCAVAKLARIASLIDEGWMPDWSDGRMKCYLSYDRSAHEWSVTVVACFEGNEVYFSSPDIARKALSEMGPDERWLRSYDPCRDAEKTSTTANAS